MRVLAAHRRAIVGGLATIVLLLGAGMWLRDSSLVGVRDVTITGVQGSQAAQVRAALEDAARDMTTLHVREDALRRAVEPYPGVASVRAYGDVPHRLRIEVRSRVAVAALDTGQRRVPVSGDGTVLAGTAADRLPAIRTKTSPRGDRVADAATQRLVRLVADAPDPLRARADRAYLGPRGLTVTLREGPRLYFGRGDRLAAKWAAAARVLADEGAQGATYLDLRLPERPAAGGLAPLATDTPDDPVTAAVEPAATSAVQPSAAVDDAPAIDPAAALPETTPAPVATVPPEAAAP